MGSILQSFQQVGHSFRQRLRAGKQAAQQSGAPGKLKHHQVQKAPPQPGCSMPRDGQPYSTRPLSSMRIAVMESAPPRVSPQKAVPQDTMDSRTVTLDLYSLKDEHTAQSSAMPTGAALSAPAPSTPAQKPQPSLAQGPAHNPEPSDNPPPPTEKTTAPQKPPESEAPPQPQVAQDASPAEPEVHTAQSVQAASISEPTDTLSIPQPIQAEPEPQPVPAAAQSGPTSPDLAPPEPEPSTISQQPPENSEVVPDARGEESQADSVPSETRPADQSTGQSQPPTAVRTQGADDAEQAVDSVQIHNFERTTRSDEVDELLALLDDLLNNEGTDLTIDDVQNYLATSWQTMTQLKQADKILLEKNPALFEGMQSLFANQAMDLIVEEMEHRILDRLVNNKACTSAEHFEAALQTLVDNPQQLQKEQLRPLLMTEPRWIQSMRTWWGKPAKIDETGKIPADIRIEKKRQEQQEIQRAAKLFLPRIQKRLEDSAEEAQFLYSTFDKAKQS